MLWALRQPQAPVPPRRPRGRVPRGGARVLQNSSSARGTPVLAVCSRRNTRSSRLSNVAPRPPPRPHGPTTRPPPQPLQRLHGVTPSKVVVTSPPIDFEVVSAAASANGHQLLLAGASSDVRRRGARPREGAKEWLTWRAF